MAFRCCLENLGQYALVGNNVSQECVSMTHLVVNVENVVSVECCIQLGQVK